MAVARLSWAEELENWKGFMELSMVGIEASVPMELLKCLNKTLLHNSA